MQEEWRDVKGFEEYYQISNLSSLKSENRVVKHKSSEFLTLKEHTIKQATNNHGYKYANLCKNAKAKKYLTHRLVASAFIENLNNKPHINHIDCNPQNNNVENLE
ncbi:MAG TPA: NUMOD4 domain-containing protein [Clostridia bacterium]|nr:NUMOD4 domain-containing protein [Clostridia bacterium]